MYVTDNRSLIYMNIAPAHYSIPSIHGSPIQRPTQPGCRLFASCLHPAHPSSKAAGGFGKSALGGIIPNKTKQRKSGQSHTKPKIRTHKGGKKVLSRLFPPAHGDVTILCEMRKSSFERSSRGGRL